MKTLLIDMSAISQLVALGCDVRNEPVSIDDLNEELLNIHGKVEDIQNAADAEERELTEDEANTIDELNNKFKKIEKDIARRETIANQVERLQSKGRKTEPSNKSQDPAHPNRDLRDYRQARDPKDKSTFGFKHFGEFAMAVRNGSIRGGELDQRLLKNAATTYSSEGVGADGGFLVPPEYRQAIMETVMAESSLLGRTDQLTSSSNTLVLPKDENTSWDSTNGVQAAWEGEADTLSQSKVALKADSVRLNKLTSLVPVTEELNEDASALDSYLRRKVPEKFDYKVNDAIVNGTGAGMPLGIMSSGALITASKESGQTASTIVFENIVNMWARMYAPYRQNAVWLINQDIEPQLLSMGFPTAATAVPVYLPPGGLSAAPYGTLMGKPVIPIESCQTLGTAGDIILADLSQYMTAMKTGGIRTDVSMHLYFDQDVLAYRFIMRVAGQPWRDNTISPANGSNTRSAFINLETRS